MPYWIEIGTGALGLKLKWFAKPQVFQARRGSKEDQKEGVLYLDKGSPYSTFYPEGLPAKDFLRVEGPARILPTQQYAELYAKARTGFRYFKCNCRAVWEEGTRDIFSPSNSECPTCNEPCGPIAYRPLLEYALSSGTYYSPFNRELIQNPIGGCAE